jgi:hypothetical protein
MSVISTGSLSRSRFEAGVLCAELLCAELLCAELLCTGVLCTGVLCTDGALASAGLGGTCGTLDAVRGRLSTLGGSVCAAAQRPTRPRRGREGAPNAPG